ncbi:MAG: hypothetical protein HKN82_08315 [Akkermansiaceae bacterium]|nr:hypothetical protein [Akkermansiaceae bacterium]NNM30256.1 hypothetical protein [Akkermansiaceae bacterium]
MKEKLWSGLMAVCSLLGLATAGEPLELGKPVPDVEGKTHEGEVVKLREAGASGWFLVYFYPKAATGG